MKIFLASKASKQSRTDAYVNIMRKGTDAVIRLVSYKCLLSYKFIIQALLDLSFLRVRLRTEMRPASSTTINTFTIVDDPFRDKTALSALWIASYVLQCKNIDVKMGRPLDHSAKIIYEHG